MASSFSPDVTQLLAEVTRGNRAAVDQLLPLLYAELRRMAGGQLRKERPDHTLQATALVHEAYLRLVDQRAVSWQNRAHFMGVAAQVMRYVLLDYAKQHGAAKRGGNVQKLTR
jgi:RNA polymerase sigma-70 factor (ECF subfamily)